MEVFGQVLGIAVFIAVTLGLIMLSGRSGGATYLEERWARGEISEEQYRRILLARLGSV